MCGKTPPATWRWFWPATVAPTLITGYLRFAVLGSVLGCLSLCVEVPDQGALRQDMTAHIVDSSGYEHNNFKYDL